MASTQNRNTGEGNQNNNTGPGNQYNALNQTFYPPPERFETPPQPSCLIPFRQDPDFVDRGTLLGQIREKCSAPASRVALVGLGGVG
ncbi:hypothetical protein EJ02DRAFT_427438 [Clathrospora elynae]|uniref:Uncharacterized protein n=1 Tax=Clathrospora elynae TaxID=706981 RepID=A0A6A5SDG5_9PLEO|nr:hypothetical protein EJ02DRAFT_427438 [Clathrospora elynae]